MGKKNYTGVRETKRRGKTLLLIDFRYTSLDGQRRRFKRFPSPRLSREAVHAEARRLMDHAAKHGVPEVAPSSSPQKPVGATYREFVEGRFSDSFMPNYRPSTRERYDALHRQRVLGFFGPLPLREITAATFRDFAAVLHAEGVQVKGPVNLVRTVLRAAEESGEIDDVPLLPRGLVKTGRKLPSAPSAADVQLMLTTEGWLGLAIALAALAGLRMGEVRALEVGDVDLEHDRLLVRRALSGDESLAPKSGHEREVPLNPRLRELLKTAVRQKLPRARVVLNGAGRTPSRQAVLTLFKAQLTRLKLKERSFHQLRHFFVSELMRQKAHPEAVRKLVGHSSLGVTDRYAHAETPDLRAAIDGMSWATGGPPSSVPR